MNNNPIFSIIVPIYNAEKYLMTTLSSLRNQKFEDFEAILVDDGSNDCSKKICEQYAENDSRFIYIKKENGGVSSARNLGINLSKGKYLLFVDADDWIENDLLSKCNDILKDHDYEMLAYGMSFDIEKNGRITRSILKKNRTIEILSPDSLDKEIITLFRNNYLSSMCNKIILKNTVDKYRCRFNEEVSNNEDLLFTLTYLENIRSIYCIDDTPYHYILRKMPGNARRYKENYESGIQVFSYEIMDTLEKIGVSKSTILWFRSTLQFVVWACIKNICRARISMPQKVARVKCFLTQKWISQIFPMSLNGNRYNDICISLYNKHRYFMLVLFTEVSEMIRNIRY